MLITYLGEHPRMAEKICDSQLIQLYNFSFYPNHIRTKLYFRCFIFQNDLYYYRHVRSTTGGCGFRGVCIFGEGTPVLTVRVGGTPVLTWGYPSPDLGVHQSPGQNRTGFPMARTVLGYPPHWDRSGVSPACVPTLAGTEVPPPPKKKNRTAEQVLATWRTVCLLWSRRRTFLL